MAPMCSGAGGVSGQETPWSGVQSLSPARGATEAAVLGAALVDNQYP